MKKLELNQMETVIASGWWEDVVIGVACGSTIVLAATANPLALVTGNACVVGMVGYGLGKY
jgi:hypothetical protein